MKCSIVMPAYRAEQFISEAIESVLDQEIEDGDSIQLIVVADGCEASYRIAETYSTDILCVLSDRNHGAYNSRNLGMLYCDYESHIIGTLDSDDMWSTNRFIETKKAFNNSSKLTIFSCPSQTITAEGDIVGNRASCAPSGQNLYTSDIVKALGMYRPWVCGADTEYQMRSQVLKSKKVITRACTYYYRSHENQLTRSKETGFGSEIRESYANQIRQLRKNKSSKHLFQKYPTPKVAHIAGEVPLKTMRELIYVGET